MRADPLVSRAGNNAGGSYARQMILTALLYAAILAIPSYGQRLNDHERMLIAELEAKGIRSSDEKALLREVDTNEHKLQFEAMQALALIRNISLDSLDQIKQISQKSSNETLAVAAFHTLARQLPRDVSWQEQAVARFSAMKNSVAKYALSLLLVQYRHTAALTYLRDDILQNLTRRLATASADRSGFLASLNKILGLWPLRDEQGEGAVYRQVRKLFPSLPPDLQREASAKLDQLEKWDREMAEKLRAVP